jgi:hypothetical protein
MTTDIFNMFQKTENLLNTEASVHITDIDRKLIVIQFFSSISGLFEVIRLLPVVLTNNKQRTIKWDIFNANYLKDFGDACSTDTKDSNARLITLAKIFEKCPNAIAYLVDWIQTEVNVSFKCRSLAISGLADIGEDGLLEVLKLMRETNAVGMQLKTKVGNIRARKSWSVAFAPFLESVPGYLEFVEKQIGAGEFDELLSANKASGKTIDYILRNVILPAINHLYDGATLSDDAKESLLALSPLKDIKPVAKPQSKKKVKSPSPKKKKADVGIESESDNDSGIYDDGEEDQTPTKHRISTKLSRLTAPKVSKDVQKTMATYVLDVIRPRLHFSPTIPIISPIFTKFRPCMLYISDQEHFQSDLGFWFSKAVTRCLTPHTFLYVVECWSPSTVGLVYNALEASRLLTVSYIVTVPLGRDRRNTSCDVPTSNMWFLFVTSPPLQKTGFSDEVIAFADCFCHSAETWSSTRDGLISQHANFKNSQIMVSSWWWKTLCNLFKRNAFTFATTTPFFVFTQSVLFSFPLALLAFLEDSGSLKLDSNKAPLLFKFISPDHHFASGPLQSFLARVPTKFDLTTWTLFNHCLEVPLPDDNVPKVSKRKLDIAPATNIPAKKVKTAQSASPSPSKTSSSVRAPSSSGRSSRSTLVRSHKSQQPKSRSLSTSPTQFNSSGSSDSD